MTDIHEAYNGLLTSESNFKSISHFFTQRKMTDIHDEINPNNMKRTKKEKISTINFLAIVIPKLYSDDNPILRIEIFGDKGYYYKGKINSFTNTSPNLLIPLNNDKELFVHIHEDNENPDDISGKKFVSFIHIPKRYQSNDTTEDDIKGTTVMTKKKTKVNLNV